MATNRQREAARAIGSIIADLDFRLIDNPKDDNGRWEKCREYCTEKFLALIEPEPAPDPEPTLSPCVCGNMDLLGSHNKDECHVLSREAALEPEPVPGPTTREWDEESLAEAMWRRDFPSRVATWKWPNDADAPRYRKYARLALGPRP